MYTTNSTSYVELYNNRVSLDIVHHKTDFNNDKNNLWTEVLRFEVGNDTEMTTTKGRPTGIKLLCLTK